MGLVRSRLGGMVVVLHRKHTAGIVMGFCVSFFVLGGTSTSLASASPKGLGLSKVQQKGLLLKGPAASYPKQANPSSAKPLSRSESLYVAAQVGKPFKNAGLPDKSSPMALTHSQLQFGTKLSQRTSLYVTASFQNAGEKRGRGGAHQPWVEKSFIMPGIGFEWRPPEKVKVGKYRWHMPQKLSLSGELRADILKRKNEPLSFKALPSQLRFNAVLLKVHYTLGSK